MSARLDVSGASEVRLVVSDAGDGKDYDHADWAGPTLTCAAPADTTPPAAPRGLATSADTSGVTLNWTANTEPDLAGYRVSRASAATGPWSVLTPTLLTAATYKDITAPGGTPSYYRVEALDKSGNVSTPASASATRPAESVPASQGVLTVENLDKIPFPDRLVFSRIQQPVPGQNVHDTVTLRVRNTGPEAVTVTEMPVQGPWTVTPAVTPASPLKIAAGAFADFTVKFTATGPGNVSSFLHEGNLTIVSNASNNQRLPVQLAGTWQNLSESNDEPTLEDIRRAFGYQFTYAKSGQTLNQMGAIVPTGDEVISAYWQRADETKPMTIVQLAAFHNQGKTATIFWYEKGKTGLNHTLTHDGSYGQSLLPANNVGGGLATVTFSPYAKTFGFNVDGGEWSDPSMNGRSENCTPGVVTQCGHDLRFWPVRDRSGTPVPNTYLMIMDYAGINYDYNDNMYLISNIRPAPVLYDVGARNAASYTDPRGNVWMPDVRTTYSSRVGQNEKRSIVFADNGGATPDEPTFKDPATIDVAGTDMGPLYQTYRAIMDPQPAQDRRIMHYVIPIDNGTYTVKLHFAELYWNAPGQRVFDVLAENTVVFPNLDIYALTNAQNTALVKDFTVTVTDGQLNIDLRATKDYGALMGLEILR